MSAAMLPRSRGTRWRGLQPLLAIVACCAMVRLLYFVIEFGLNVPIGDDWDLLRTILSWRTNGFSTSSLFSFHNEHRIVATRLIFGFLLPLVDGNLKSALLFNLSLVLLTLVVILVFLRDDRPHPIYPVFAYAAIASLVSGWFQWQNLIWSFQLPWLLLPLLLVLSIWSIVNVRNGAVCVTAVACLLLLSLCAQANGIVVWLAITPALLFRTEHWPLQRRIALLGIFCVAIMTAGWLYFRDIPAYVAKPSVGWIVLDPTRFIHFFLASLGSPFSAPLALTGPERWVGTTFGSLALGLALVAVFPAWRRRHEDGRPAPLALALGLLIFGAVSLSTVSLGRFRTFSPDAIESRYSTLALYFHAGTLLLLYLIATRERAAGRITSTVRLAFLSGCCALIIASTWGDRLLLGYGLDLNLAFSRIKASLELSVALPNRPELSEQIHTVPLQMLTPLLDGLERHDLWTPKRWVSRSPADILRFESTGNVDRVESDGTDSVLLQGWGRLPSNFPADAIVALVQREDGSLVPVAISDRARPVRTDVSATFDHNFLSNSGWLMHMKRDDYLRRPILAAYSASDDLLYGIPFIWLPVSQ